MADFLICPRCRRQNAADAIFCNRCGVRLLSAGVSYRNRGSSSAVGMSQIVLGLGVLILAGLVLGGGAVVLLGGQRPTPSRISGLPSTSPSGLPTFVQATATAVPTGTFVLPTLIPTVAPSALPTATAGPTLGPTVPPTATPVPTPQPTPVDCAVASTGTDVKEAVLGYGNKSTRGPIGKVWCILDVTVHPLWGTGVSSYGRAWLQRDDKIFGGVDYTCSSSSCTDAPFSYVPPRRLPVGTTLRYFFLCQNADETLEDDCTDGAPDGMTIIIHYEAFDAP
ncbi:MAG: zinc ribbon domain-containing protein [Chloroflexota bacterium]